MSSDGFSNEAVGGTTLVRSAIKSPNFITGVSGWTINQDGSAEFDNLTIRGTFQGTNFILNSSGLFFYNGTPSSINPPVFWVVAPGVTTDPFGNPVTPVLGAGTPFNPLFIIDQFGNLTSTASDTSQVGIQSGLSVPLSLTQALAGQILGGLTFLSSDPTATQLGLVADVTLGTGSTEKPSLLLASPYSGTGAGILLQSVNDAASDLPWITFGTTAQQAPNLVFSPLFAFTASSTGVPAFVMYSGSQTINVVTKTSGSGSITITGSPASIKAEAWGAGGGGGGGGQTGGITPEGAGGGGGGEYAVQTALVPSGGAVTYAVGAGGTAGSGTFLTPSSGSAGGNSTVTGTTTLTAHGGGGGSSSAGTGGTGATGASAHFNGGAGGTPADGGSGGGSSGGTNSAGNAGGNGGTGVPAGGGASAVAVTGGGPGGHGGASQNGTGVGGRIPSTGPGGGGGGGGDSLTNNGGTGGTGANGQIRVTWSTGAPAVGFSINFGSAFNDQFGTSIPAGFNITQPVTLTGIATPSTPAAGKGVLYATTAGALAEVLPSGYQGELSSAVLADFTQTIVTGTGNNVCGKSWSIPANDGGVAGVTYEFDLQIVGTQGSTVQALTIGWQLNGGSIATVTFPSGLAVINGTFGGIVNLIITIATTGSGGTYFFALSGVVGAVIQGTLAANHSTGNAINTTIANTVQFEAGWGSTTGAPTMTTVVSRMRRIT